MTLKTSHDSFAKSFPQIGITSCQSPNSPSTIAYNLFEILYGRAVNLIIFGFLAFCLLYFSSTFLFQLIVILHIHPKHLLEYSLCF
ncbi:hypothetical protein CW304_26140 [Bacillus sp. UFRGS-B20]|nr:hypothetical protein CW304_26140 [Bacillus sp. UFRGS-B20]